MRTMSWLSMMVAVGGMACAEVEPGLGGDDTAEGAEPSAADTEHAKLELERSLRALDRGADLATARETLARLTVDEALTVDDQDEAHLALARADAALGDEEAALSTLEKFLALRADQDRTAARERAEKHLRFLLTGSETTRDVRLPTPVATAPIANALAGYFPADADGRVLIDVLALGIGRGRDSGIYEIAEARRSVLEQDLTAKVDVGQSISSGDWVSLPRALGEKRADMPHPDRSMLVFYFDLGDKRVPARYDAYLPIPSDEIVERLERGEAFVVARERPSARPTIVLAAPRAAQLELVEQAFSKMTSLPLEPSVVPLEPRLLPSEIQGHIRAARGPIAKCYETARARSPELQGTLMINFEIDGQGRVSDTKLETTSLDDADLLTCIEGLIQKITFPATGGPKMTVRYPLSMTP